MESLAALDHLQYASLSPARALKPQTTGGKISLPVNSVSTYTQFKHIAAVPSGRSGNGYSLSKIQILDSLIDRLIQVRSKSSVPTTEQRVGMSDEAIDALIDEIATKLNTALHSGAEKIQQNFGIQFATPFGTGADSGLMINLSV
jgi:hypothetical protein